MNSVSQREKKSDHLLEKIRLVVCDLDGTLLRTNNTCLRWLPDEVLYW